MKLPCGPFEWAIIDIIKSQYIFELNFKPHIAI